jgi:hypothetical protein
MLLDEFSALQVRVGQVLGRKWRKPAAGTRENAKVRSAAPEQGR